MSNQCLIYVFILSFPNICLVFNLYTQLLSSINPGFDLGANLYLVFVLKFLPFVIKINHKVTGPKLDKDWSQLFKHKSPGHPVPGHKMDKCWIFLNPIFVPFSSINLPYTKSLYITVCMVRTNPGQNLDWTNYGHLMNKQWTNSGPTY